MNPQHEVISYIDMAMHELEDAKRSNSEEDSYQDTKLHLDAAIRLVKIALENVERNEIKNSRFRKLLNKD